ncbi:MAG: MotA/TolQ/ExbB proton channel family protein [Syntrophobacterales bacterium]|nr:MAG: MotA/TolQ/ExbB proton channel family protein [Syntrophobacterales bacterium]
MYDLVVKGGVLMIPIALCSIIALAIFLERLWSLRRSRVIPRDFLIEIEDLIRREKIPEAITRCRKDNSSMANIILAGIRNFGKRREIVKESIEEIGRREAATLERYINVVGTIAAIAPLLGLLGTVFGMIKAFNVISIQGVGNPSSLAGGISEALITTAAGLVVAIPTFVLYRYLANKADALIVEMEEQSIRMVDLLKQRER